MDNEQIGTPDPIGKPPQSSTATHQDWVMHQLHHVNRELGILCTKIDTQKESLDALANQDDKLTKSINRINITIATASGAIVVIVAIAGYLIDKNFDKIFELLAK